MLNQSDKIKLDALSNHNYLLSNNLVIRSSCQINVQSDAKVVPWNDRQMSKYSDYIKSDAQQVRLMYSQMPK